MTYFPCLASVTIIYCVVVGQRSPATPPSILLASDPLSSNSGQKPLPVVSSDAAKFCIKRTFFFCKLGTANYLFRRFRMETVTGRGSCIADFRGKKTVGSMHSVASHHCEGVCLFGPQGADCKEAQGGCRNGQQRWDRLRWRGPFII